MDQNSSTQLEGIAVIGMSGRFPGARNIAHFWDNLMSGVESISRFTDDELLASGISPDLLGRTDYVKARAVLDDVDLFDADFFGLHPRDAELTDPQHRIFLECAWEALEGGGYDPRRTDALIGVFAGSSMNTYLLANLATDRVYLEDFVNNFQVGNYQTLIGNDKDYLATRVSYKLDLKGPSVTVQTACSTSLVAIAQAVSSLLSHECDMALAGGVSLSFPQARGTLYQEGGMTSPDGHCRAFDAASAGTVFGSGAGVVLLKRLEDAVSDGDTIHAVIKGSAVNNDGANKASYLAPSSGGQANVISMAHAVAGIDAGSIGYVEAHGTGTPLGDPIEVAGLTKAFRESTNKVGYCVLGSVKPNVGHLEAAAGVTGLIKAIQSVKHGLIPPTLHFDSPNPQIAFEGSPFFVSGKALQWPAIDGPRRAGVSSFGVGGTNAHVVIEEPPLPLAGSPSRDYQLLLLSAKTQSALDAATENLEGYLSVGASDVAGEIDLADVAYTLQVGRSEFSCRKALVCSSIADAIGKLKSGDSVINRSTSSRSAQPVFAFPGQGSQHIDMAKSIYDGEPRFREVVDECSEILAPILGLDIRDLLYPDSADAAAAGQRLSETQYTQPALFVVEYALAQQWIEWGVNPSAMIGHSIGEYVAATIAGVFSLTDSLKVVAERARLMQSIAPGAMVSVRAAEAVVLGLIGGGLALAAVNSATACVVSGPIREIERFEIDLSAQGVQYRRLQTSHAFHSSMMDPILDEFAQKVAAAKLNPPSIPYISNLTGTWITEDEAVDPRYYASHLRNAVRFSDGVATLMSDFAGHPLLEVGPGVTLATLARQNEVFGADSIAISTLGHATSDQSATVHLLEAVGSLWTTGVTVNWGAFYQAEQRRRIALPSYPFERRRYWVAPPQSQHGAKALWDSSDLVASQMAVLEVNKMPDSSNSPTPGVGSHSGAGRADRIAETLIAITHALSGIATDHLDQDVTFLDLGLDSLFLTQASQAFSTKFGVEIKFRHLLDEHGTVRKLAAFIDSKLPPEPVDKSPGTLPLSPSPVVTQQDRSGQPVDTFTTGTESSVERVIREQLALMARQLELLGSPQTTVPTGGSRSEFSTAFRHMERDVAGESGNTDTNDSKTFGPGQPTVLAAIAAPRIAEPPIKAFGPYRPIDKGESGGLTARQKAELDSLISRYTRQTPLSKQITLEGRGHLADPRVVAGFKSIWKEMVYPIVSARSSGSKIYDVDGNAYIDVAMGFGLNLIGHSPQFITHAVLDQLERGVEIGPQSPLAGTVAKLLCEMVGMDRATFCNTGSEAVMAALRVARTVTGRNKIVYFTGDYHGTFDEVLGRVIVSDPERAVAVAPGIPPGMLDDAIILEYGTQASLDAIARLSGTLAAVLVEPVQSRRPELQPVEFLRAVRELTEESGTALIFDEVITGFRCHPGGAQALFGVKADLATYGKVIGGGMPIGAVAGSSKFMDAFDGGAWQYGDDSFPEVGVTFFAGTFVRHPLALAAAHAMLTYLKDQGPKLQTDLNARTTEMVHRINTDFDAAGVPLRISHFASLFYMSYPHDIKYGSLVYFYLRAKGIHIWEGRPCFLSTAHADHDIDAIVEAFAETVVLMQDGGFLPGRPEGFHQPSDALTKDVAGNERPAGDSEPLTILGGRLIAPDGAPASVGALSMSVPTTAAQREVWVTCQMAEGASCALNESLTLRMRGNFDVDIMRKAMVTVVDRHEALRTTFSVDGDFQRTLPSIPCDLAVHDLADLENDERRRSAGELLHAEGRTPLDLANGPLVRGRIVRLAPNYHLVIVTAHHIICDGWSAAVLLEELGAVYTSLVKRAPLELPEPKRFSEFACDQLNEPYITRATTARNFWLEQLRDLPEALCLPSDRPRRPNHKFEGSRSVTAIPGPLVERLRKIGSSNGSTLYTTLLAGYAAFLYRLTGQSELLIGVPSAGQSQGGNDQLVGHCVSLLPLRVSLKSNSRFLDLLASVKAAINDANDHPECTIGSLSPEALAGRDSLAGPLISVAFNFEKEIAGLEFGSLTVEVDVNPRSYSQFEMGLNLVDVGNSIRLECDYRSDLFDETTIQSWLNHFVHLLGSAASDPTTPVGTLALLSAAEIDTIIGDWAGRENQYGREKSIADFFAEQVAARPDAIAVELADMSLTYRNLDVQATNLAVALQAAGVTAGSRVGICLGRSIERIIGLVGIVKTGAAYVPIDPDYPAGRIVYMATDSECLVTVTNLADIERLTSLSLKSLAIESVAAAPQGALKPCQATGGSLAYVMYTSGSTGNPKGALVTNRGVTRMVKTPNYINLGPDETLLHVAPYTFDGATFEIWSALLNGGRLVVMPGEQPTLREIGDVMTQKGVTTSLLTTGLFHGMVDHELVALSGLRNLIAGGDIVSPAHVRTVLEALPNCRMMNAYGPTENAVITCCHTVEEDDTYDALIPIGRPISNTTVYILDRNMAPVPPGFSGELFTGGDGVALGYTGAEGMEKFVPNPFSTVEGARLYATGDRARWRSDGVVEFLGRLDSQVKLRGHRIEPGEIENVICEHPGVMQALVDVADHGNDDKRLIAYYVAIPGSDIDPLELRSFVGERLPSYMAPSDYVKLEAIPLTRNGKPDRKALPNPNEAAVVLAAPTPQDSVIETLIEIWRGLLGARQVGLDDDFYRLGGHSLLAIRMCAEVEERLHARITVSSVLEGPTVRQLARRVRRLNGDSDEMDSAVKCLTPIQPNGSRPPLYCVHHVDGVAICYKELAEYLPSDQPVIGIESRSVSSEIAPLKRIEDIAEEYLSEIKRAQPEGPYLLCGISFGGVVAFEMARQLVADGREVAFLGLIDTYGPAYYRMAVSHEKERPIMMRAVEQFQTFNALEANGKLGFVKTKAKSAFKRLRQMMPGGTEPGFDTVEGFVAERLRTVREANYEALGQYYPGSYSGEMTLFRAKERLDRTYSDPLLSWGGLADKGIVIREVLGNHYTIIQNPFVKHLAREIESCLTEVIKDV